MREIKFRAWDIEGKKMVKNFAHVGNGGRMYTIHHEQPENDYEVMQFTGLLDKNGKEIYEGDIVKYWLPTLKRWEVGDVRWDDMFASWSMFGNWCDNDWVKIESKEVIGNIYENPELLTHI